MELDRPPFENFEPGDFPRKEKFDVMELKIDGHWAQLLINDGIWQIWSRSGNLRRQGVFSSDVGRTLIHGEFVFGTEWAKDRPDLYGKVACHTIVEMNGEKLTHYSNSDMRDVLFDFLDIYGDEDIIKDCFMVEQYPIKDGLKIWRDYVEGQKYEGLIFKRSGAPWGSAMGRMKQVATMDYVCMDVLESDSDTYKGWGAQSIVGGLYVKGKLVKICKVSGMTNEQREDFLKNKKDYIGRVFECEGKKISKKGAIRHPNFLRWRDDKIPEECTWI